MGREQKSLHIRTPVLVLFIKVSGRMDFVMAQVAKLGQMGPLTTENGRTTKRAVTANSLMLKATLMKVNGPTTKPMDTEFISM